ncbi:MAG: hypothetical protein COB36_10885 [Alphaproteobacteria bacterium]|nr:MAG: hypothetical protein COB36_10885 [Alphaproteobacteria bacterium]
MSNLELWNKVCKTDPGHTKKVNMRGGFTAIDAHYQIQNATEQFGPVGTGWGYRCNYIYQEKFIFCELIFWYTDTKNTFGPISGCSELIDKNGKPDTDAGKKAMTDALTKALSHLGFNADVFLGKFDDNKYVAEAKKEFAEPVQLITKDQVSQLDKAISVADVDVKTICNAYQITTLSNLPSSAFDNAMGRLRASAQGKAA